MIRILHMIKILKKEKYILYENKKVCGSSGLYFSTQDTRTPGQRSTVSLWIVRSTRSSMASLGDRVRPASSQKLKQKQQLLILLPQRNNEKEHERSVLSSLLLARNGSVSRFLVLLVSTTTQYNLEKIAFLTSLSEKKKYFLKLYILGFSRKPEVSPCIHLSSMSLFLHLCA